MEVLNATLGNKESADGNESSTESPYIGTFRATPYIYALPIIAAIGIFLNIILLAILRNSSLRCEITGIYLKAIAISDIGFLVFALFPWIQMVFQINVYHNVGFCQLVNFAMTVFPSLSLFFILSFAINGVVWKTRPWLRPELPEVLGSKSILLGITFFAVYLQVYPFWFWESSSETSNQCTVHYDNSNYFSAFLKFDMFLDFLVQIALIALGVGYGRWSRPTGETTSLSTPTPSLSFHARNMPDDISFLNFRQIFLVFLVSVVFLSLPTNSFVLASLYFPDSDLHIWADWIGLLFYMHFAVKPFGYLTLLAEFREVIKKDLHTLGRKISSLQNVDVSNASEEFDRLNSNE